MDRIDRKNKFLQKSDNSRSKYVTRTQNRAVQAPIIETPEIRQAAARPITQVPGSSQNIQGGVKSSIHSIKTNTVNTVYVLARLGVGETLKDIIISHWNSGSTDSVISLYWSFTPIEDFTFTVASGRISSSTPGSITRLFTITIPHASTMSLNNEGMIKAFSGFDKTLYLYAVSSVQYTQWTVIKDINE